MNSEEFSNNREDAASGSITRWIDLFREGDDEAAKVLWDRYFSSLIALAHSKLGGLAGSTLDAEDIALSAFHTLYRSASADRLPDLSDRDDLWRSMLLITSGKVVDAKRREFSMKRGGIQSSKAHVELLDLVQSDAPDPEVAAMLSEEFNRLLESLGEQELKDIAVFKLEGFTNQDIAAKVGCSERTVKRRIAVIRRIWEESGLAPSNQ